MGSAWFAKGVATLLRFLAFSLERKFCGHFAPTLPFIHSVATKECWPTVQWRFIEGVCIDFIYVIALWKHLSLDFFRAFARLSDFDYLWFWTVRQQQLVQLLVIYTGSGAATRRYPGR